MISTRGLASKILIMVLVVAVVAAGVWLVGFSSVLAAKSVSVKGAETIPVAEVQEIAEVPLGTPLARVDLALIAARVRSLKPVADATVAHAWPNTVEITVVERTPIFAVADAGKFLLVDKTGLGYRSVDKAPKGLMVAEVSVDGADEPGNADRANVLADVGIVAQALPKDLTAAKKPKDRVKTIKASSIDTIELVLGNGRRVIWGSADQSDLKAQVALALLQQKADVYDVSAPTNPTTR